MCCRLNKQFQFLGVILFPSQWVNQRRRSCSVIHSIVWLTTGPYPLPEWVLHRVWCSASSLHFLYPLISLRSPSSCLHFLPCLLIFSIPSSFLPSVTCFRRPWSIQLSLYFFVVCKCSSPPWPCVILYFHMINPTVVLHSFPAPHFKTF